MFLLDRYLIIIFLVVFSLYNFHYIYQRFIEKKTLYNDEKNHFLISSSSSSSSSSLLHNYNINEWLNTHEKLIQRDTDNNHNESLMVDNTSLCKSIVAEINDEIKDCHEMSQNLCNGKILLKKFTIPLDSTIDFYSHSGYKLTKGQSYCIYKPPPDINSQYKCNETWGFWKYSLNHEMWQCKSKVPGIYNEEKNAFDPCSKGNGSLYHNGHYLPNEFIPLHFSPEQFYSLKFQRQFQCDCPRGYISKPELSRTTCFRDPCLINLPLDVVAAGYDAKTGNCNCTPYFYNLYPHNLKSPCSMCPNAPILNHHNNELILFVKCGKGFKFQCLTEEDELRGCIKTRIDVKLKGKDLKFKNLVFF